MPISTAVDASAIARVVGIQSKFENRRAGQFNLLPQRVAVIGQGNSAASYSTTKAQYTSALAVAQAYGFGSPLHHAALQLLPVNGDGIGTIPMTVYPLEDAGSGVASSGTITPSGAQTEAAAYVVRVSNIESQEFVIDVGDTVATITAAITAAINATLAMPVIATDNTTDVGLAAKWAGTSSNKMFIEVAGSTTAGTVFTIGQMAGGLVNPDIQPALDQVGEVWETMFLNCMEPADSDALDALETFGLGRWGALTRKPMVSFVGDNTVLATGAITIPDGRKNDRTNVQLVAPGSDDLLFVIAARQLARIVSRANNNPAHDYGSLQADGITPGPDSEQWLYADRDLAVKGGSSTIVVRDGVVNVGDVVTFYHPDGDPTPAYRYVVDIVRLQNVIYNIDLEFASAKWDGAPLIPDNQPTVNPDAKKPKMAVAAAASIIDNLALEAILAEPEVSKAGIIAEIDAGNPKRLNLCIPITLSGNTNITSIDLKWGFLFGTPSVIV